MAISLRSYNREIESLINNGQNEEAIAHCLHILRTYSRHIDTYRLLGKAYLESERYSDAADILQRVLSSVPDDFVSHVGMSIIREDEGNLDEAIWHMERAYEVQPSNGAIQGELRRLYGRRDGIEPAKVRLTRGALARMYVKGELYQQAIAEIRAALADSPNRLDLQVLLARAYASAEQRVEAVEVCNGLLRKLPNCLEANRIMSEVLVKTERQEDTQNYRMRLQELDPYYAYLAPGMKSPERVPDQSVMLDKLEAPVTAGSHPAQPDWVTSLGMEIGAEAPQENLPEWLVNLQETSQAERERELPDYPPRSPAIVPEGTGEEQAISEPPSAPEPAAAQDVDISADADIPEWLKDIGWGPATGEATQAPAAFEEPGEPASPQEVEGEALAAEDLPDWLKAVAPFEADLNPELDAPSLGAAFFPLPEDEQPHGEMQPPAGEPVLPTPVAGPAPEADIPEWLREFDSSVGEPAPAAEDTETAAFSPSELPDWLQELPSASPEIPAPGESESLPPVLETSPEPPDAAPQTPEEQSEPAAKAAGTGGLPDWIRDLLPGAAVAAVQTQGAGEEPSTPIDDEGQESPEAALAGLDTGEDIEAEPALPDLPADKQPDLSEEQVGAQPAAPQAPEIGLPEWLDFETSQEMEGIAAGPYDIEGADATFEWMDDLAARQVGSQPLNPVENGQQAPAEEELPVVVEPLDSQPLAADIPDAEPAEIPDWLKEVAGEPLESILAQPDESLPAGEADLEWLDSLTAGQEVPLDLPAGAAAFPFAAADEWRLESEVGLEPGAQSTPPVGETPVYAGESAPIGDQVIPTSDQPQEGDWMEESMFDAAFHEADTKPVRVKPVTLPKEQPVQAEGVTPALAHEQETWDEPGLPPPLPYFRDELEEPEIQPAGRTPAQAPNQTSEQAPIQATGQAAQPAPLEIPGWLEADTLVPEEEESPVPDITFDLAESGESLAYLESLALPPAEEAAPEQAVVQDAQPASEPVEQVGVETLVQPPIEASTAEQPVDLSAEQPVDPSAEQQIDLSAEQQIELPPVEIEPVEPQPEQTIAQVEELAPEKALPEEPPAEPGLSEEAQAAEPPAPTPAGIEIPEWLRGIELEQPETALEAPAALASEAEIAAEPVTPELPAWQPEEPLAPQFDLNQASLAELERLPGMGFILAQELVSHREQFGPFHAVEDLLTVPGFNQANLDLFKDRLFIAQVAEATQAASVEPVVESVTEVAPASPEIPITTEAPAVPEAPIVPEAPAIPEAVAALQPARLHLEAGDLESAVNSYTTLIKQRQLLPDVIADLRAALDRYPQEFSLWQALGDACLRNDQFQEALSAYNKAEDLL